MVGGLAFRGPQEREIKMKLGRLFGVATLAATMALMTVKAHAEIVIRFSHTQPETMSQGSHAMATVAQASRN